LSKSLRDDVGREIHPCGDGTWEYDDGSKVLDTNDPTKPLIYDTKKQMEYLRIRSVELSGMVIRRVK
jgi:hypothetical protein